MKTPDHGAPYAHPAWLILILSLAPNRLCPRQRRRRSGAKHVLGPDRGQRLRDALGMAPGARARPRRPLNHDHSRRQRVRRRAADLRHSPILLAISALVFGVAFFAVVGSTTAFVRFNYPPAAWPTGIAAMTIAFGIGQTLGPIVVGAISDAVGSLSFALNVSATMLALGATAAAFQRQLGLPERTLFSDARSAEHFP